MKVFSRLQNYCYFFKVENTLKTVILTFFKFSENVMKIWKCHKFDDFSKLDSASYACAMNLIGSALESISNVLSNSLDNPWSTTHSFCSTVSWKLTFFQFFMFLTCQIREIQFFPKIHILLMQFDMEIYSVLRVIWSWLEVRRNKEVIYVISVQLGNAEHYCRILSEPKLRLHGIQKFKNRFFAFFHIFNLTGVFICT